MPIQYKTVTSWPLQEMTAVSANSSQWMADRYARVEILLSTYNGEDYLPSLLDSILDQTYPCWKMTIRDDGSTDSSLDIIRRYQDQWPERFFIMALSGEHLGPTRSFSVLMEHSDADILAICDQDDVWHKEKLSIQVMAMECALRRWGTATPVLVHSDLRVCDTDMNEISRSMWKFQNIDPQRMKQIQCLLIHNFVSGCTMVVNRSLLKRVCPIPPEAVIYDWWVALIALITGHIITIETPLVNYRQHRQNAVGARNWKSYFANRSFKRLLGWYQVLKNTAPQAVALKGRLQSFGVNHEVVSGFCGMQAKGFLARKRLYRRLGVFKYGRVRQIISYLFM
ncbi:MAG: glycosyltransferase family 2 protein [Desulfobacteraceae bacterium]|nr:MAG: glycosyltransferase family 2 protein [Desulfobacteraceae bacterium]